MVAQEVVGREEVGHGYFTLSASGVVEIKAGTRSEFTPLGEWMREKSIFNVLTRMKFFKHYLVYKAFHSWRSSVRQKLFAQVTAAAAASTLSLPPPGSVPRPLARRGIYKNEVQSRWAT